VAAVGPRLTEVAAEVGDGVIIHPFSTRRSLLELTMPAVSCGLAVAGRDRADLEVIVVCLLATGATGAELDRSIAVVRKQLAFYASTPAYARVLEVHGWDGLHPQLNRLSKEGRWDDMADLVPDELIEAVAVVGRRDAVPGLVREKLAGVADTVSIECTRQPDPAHFADIVAGLGGGGR
jgi:probable F420-dependent oxidoreductase